MLNKIWLIIVIWTLVLPFWNVGESILHAQNDPTLATMIVLYTNKAKDELKQQEQMMLLETTGHIWMTEEVNATTDLQKEFNTYLDSFNNIIAYAAQIYGFYYEIDRLLKNLDTFTRMLGSSTSNALAVALSSNRNQIYREFIWGSVDIINDIRQVCFSNIKMTEKERLEVVFNIRPKLKLINTKLKRLIKAIKYTSFTDVWAEIDYNSRESSDKTSIVKQCMERWKRNGKIKH